MNDLSDQACGKFKNDEKVWNFVTYANSRKLLTSIRLYRKILEHRQYGEHRIERYWGEPLLPLTLSCSELAALSSQLGGEQDQPSPS